MRLLICGGRNFTDVEYAIPRFHRVHLKTPVTTLICGMAHGGDMIGHAWAKEMGIPTEEYPITKEAWDRHGNAAGPIRNLQMLKQGKPDLVLGLPGGNGTAHMLSIADKAGVEIIEYKYHYFSRARDPIDGYLSNFFLTNQIDANGLVYQTNEHYYQAEKTLDPDKREWIRQSSGPGEAKRRGNSNTVPLRPDWEDGYKFEAMRVGLGQKFHDNSPLTEMLVGTNDDYRVEFAPWGDRPDRFWGVDKEKKGLNWLGRFLMRRRDEVVATRG